MPELTRYLEEMLRWPFLPETEHLNQQQINFVLKQRSYWQGKTLWLFYLLDGQHHLRDMLLSPELLPFEPAANLSVRLRLLCREVFERSARFQAVGVENFTQLWFACEFSLSQNRLRGGWIGGKPDTTLRGKIKGKTQILKESTQALNVFETALDNDWTIPELLHPDTIGDVFSEAEIISLEHDGADVQPGMYVEAAVLCEATALSAELTDGDTLKHQLRQYISDKRHYDRVLKNSSDFQLEFLPSPTGSITSTRKGAKPPQAQAIAPIKRGRGRPPKGNKRGFV